MNIDKDELVAYLDDCMLKVTNEIESFKQSIKVTDDHNIVHSYVNAINRDITVFATLKKIKIYVDKTAFNNSVTSNIIESTSKQSQSLEDSINNMFK